MTDPISIASGQWLRHGRYEVRDGCVVPVKGSKSRVYDPWALRERPYESLAAIVSSRECLTLPAQQPKLVREILDWCGHFGLLGTLLHRVVGVTQAARWKRLEFADKVERDHFCPEQTTRLYIPGGWLTRVSQFSPPVIKDRSKLDAPVSLKELPQDAQQPEAVLVDLPGVTTAGGLLKREALDKTWGSHFPDLPFWERVTHDYPVPSSREFFAIYGEPVHEFVDAAWLLRNAVDAISRPVDAGAPARGINLLRQLAARTSATLEQQRDGSLRQRWVSGSLLSSLALMAMEDLAADRLHRCATCERMFLSALRQIEYCSPTCRHTMQKRRFRAKYPTYERTARKRRSAQEEH